MKLGVMKDEQGNRIKEDVEYVMRDSDKALIPCVEGNLDYQQYLKDVKDGAEVTDFDYEAEDLRQAEAEEAPKELTLEERVKALEEKTLQKIPS